MSAFDAWLFTLNLGSSSAEHIDDDADGSFDCVDVPEDWCKFLWPKVPINQILGYGNAKDLYGNSSVQYFDKLPPNITAQPGDIPVWGATSLNSYGHIAVTIHDDGTNLTVVEQNTYTQEAATKAVRTHTNLIGFLRPKGGDMPEPANEGDLENIFEAVYALPVAQNDKDYWLPKKMDFKTLFYAVKDSKRYATEHFINDGDIVNMKAKGIDISGAKGKMWKSGLYASSSKGISGVNRDSALKYVQDNLK